MPIHIAVDAGLIAGIGSWFTVTARDALAEQLFASVTTTEYVVVMVGETVVAEVASVLLHR